MRTSLGLSVIALLSAAILSSGTQAASIHLGGNSGNLINLGGAGSNSDGNLLGINSGNDAAVNVNLGNGNGANVEGVANADVTVNTGAGNSGLLNLGNGDDALINIGGGSTSADGNGLVDVALGNDGGGATVNLNTGGTGGNLLDLGGDGGALSLGGDGDLLDLGGTETTAAIDLGDTGNATVDLFGDGNDANATINLGGANADGVLDLFGSEGGSNAVIDVGGLGILDGIASPVDLTNLFGVELGSSSSAGAGGSGVSGGIGGSVDDDDGSAPVVPGTDLFGSGSTHVASIDAGIDSSCFMPSDAQVAKLVARHTYTQSLMQSWAGTTQLKVVKVGLCTDARASLDDLLADNGNVSHLQDYLARFPAIRAGLKSEGVSTGDVIAVDRSGKTLVVYVI